MLPHDHKIRIVPDALTKLWQGLSLSFTSFSTRLRFCEHQLAFIYYESIIATYRQTYNWGVRQKLRVVPTSYP